MTHRSFTDSASLLNFLIGSYNREIEEIEMSGEENSKLCLRVTANMKSWISDQPSDFDPKMRENVLAFISQLEVSDFKACVRS